MDSIKAIEVLRSDLRPLNEIKEISTLSGIYAIGYTGSDSIEGFSVEKLKHRDIIYIGKTKQSAQKRILNTHFKTGRTGSSTLRRSIGAILREQLDLQPTQRGSTHSGMRDFTFTMESEKSLTEWMINNLSVSFVEYDFGKRLLNRLENEIIYILNPVLNIANNPNNKNIYMIKDLRRKCREIARIRGIQK